MSEGYGPEREPEFDGGAEPVRKHPGDRPGNGRGAALTLVALLGLLALAMPVAWGVGLLAGLGDVLGPATLTILWIVWGVVVALFLWSAWSMWRRAA